MKNNIKRINIKLITLMYLNILFVFLGVFVNGVMGTNITDTLRIVGGTPILKGELPNLVYVKSFSVVNEEIGLGAFTCSGTLINAILYPELFPRVTNEFFVITAAHCVTNLDIPYQIQSRIEILWNPDDKLIANMKTFVTGNIIIHPKYNNYIVAKNQKQEIVGYDTLLYNDIAIVEVFVEGEDDWVNKLIKVDFTKDISDFPVDEKYIQAGFGPVIYNTPLPDRGYWYTSAFVYTHSETIKNYNTKYSDVKTLYIDPLVSNNRFKIISTKPDLFFGAPGDSGGALWASDKTTIVGIASTIEPDKSGKKAGNSYVTISIFLSFIQIAVDQIIPLKAYSSSYTEYNDDVCDETLSTRDIPEYVEKYFSNKGVMSPYLDYVIFNDAETSDTDYTTSHYLPDYSNPKIFGTHMYIPISQSPQPIDYITCLKNGKKITDKCVKKLVKYPQTSYKSDDFVINDFLERTYDVINSGDVFSNCDNYAVVDQYLRDNSARYSICKIFSNYPGCDTLVPEYNRQTTVKTQLGLLLKMYLDANPKACENTRVVWIRNNDFQTSKNSYYEYCNIIPLPAEFPISGTLIVEPLICIQYLNYP
jgi:hypothetical protein